MTPEQTLEAFQSQLRLNQDIQTQISGLREEQALLMSYCREQAARRDRERLIYERDRREMNQRIENLRLDFLNHLRLYHPPSE